MWGKWYDTGLDSIAGLLLYPFDIVAKACKCEVSVMMEEGWLTVMSEFSKYSQIMVSKEWLLVKLDSYPPSLSQWQSLTECPLSTVCDTVTLETVLCLSKQNDCDSRRPKNPRLVRCSHAHPPSHGVLATSMMKKFIDSVKIKQEMAN